MKASKFLLPATVFATILVFAFFTATSIHAQMAAGDASHQGQIYGIVQTKNRATTSQFRMQSVTILVRNYSYGKSGRIVGFSPINDGKYAVNMGDLPAGKYTVAVDPGGSFYMPGSRMVDYPGRAGSARQDWTISTDQIALPSLQ